MGVLDSSDGLTDADRDEREWAKSNTQCFCCEDDVNYGDECVELRLVYPSSYNSQPTLLDALDEQSGEFTEDPLHFCFSCWDAHVEDLRETLKDIFVTRKRSIGASPLRCAFCSTYFNWGDFVAYAAYGELDVSPRTNTTQFTPNKYEALENAELLCMDCIEWINDNLEENIWTGLWTDEVEEKKANEDPWWRQ